MLPLRCSHCQETIFDGHRFYDCSCQLNRAAAGNGKCTMPSLAQVQARQESEVIKMRGRIEHIERSEKYDDLRWLRLAGCEQPFSLWDSVYDRQLVLGQEVEYEAQAVDGRNFRKITKLAPVKGNRKSKQKQKSKAQAEAPDAEAGAGTKAEGFSKTEIGLMASVALKVAAKLQGDPEDLEGLFKRANIIYAWLADKRVEELRAQ